jgi:hypothetical protein
VADLQLTRKEGGMSIQQRAGKNNPVREDEGLTKSTRPDIIREGAIYGSS